MTTVLNHAVDIMKHRGYDLAWLRGDRTRYRAFGWEVGGKSGPASSDQLGLAQQGARSRATVAHVVMNHRQ
jgi:hypothetical protein